jgi:protein SCO1/2/putative membrane protein
MRRLPAALLALPVFALACLAAVPSASDFDSLDVDLGPIADFSLTNQDGRTVTRQDLLGKVWVASFIFRSCPGECVKITESLKELQDHLGRQEDVVLVSFTVDPERDTPELLKKFAFQKGADLKRWWFLTGPEPELYRLIVESFHEGVRRQKPLAGQSSYDVTHSAHLVVVDAKGQYRGYIDGTKPEGLPRLQEKIRWLILAKYHYLPTINGSLNALSGLLLVLGYIAIRCRRVSVHKAFMWSALVVSGLFLGCYLFYHFVILRGHQTGFPGEGTIRPVYFGVLISHTVLAAVVAPLAVLVAYRGARGQLARHVRLARWTLPAWLYVSVTGVLVYWMRYHLYP